MAKDLHCVSEKVNCFPTQIAFIPLWIFAQMASFMYLYSFDVHARLDPYSFIYLFYDEKTENYDIFHRKSIKLHIL